MLDVKKVLTKILSMFNITKVTFTTNTGSNYSGYGGCFYEKCGRLVHIHIGVSGLSGSSAIKTIPEIKPNVQQFGMGTGGSTNSFCIVEVNTSGGINVYPSTGATYCGADVYYLI